MASLSWCFHYIRNLANHPAQDYDKTHYSSMNIHHRKIHVLVTMEAFEVTNSNEVTYRLFKLGNNLISPIFYFSGVYEYNFIKI